MTTTRWTRESTGLDWEGSNGDHIDYCGNAVGAHYRLRPAFTNYPVPLPWAMSFHRTLAEAKRFAETIPTEYR